MGGEFCQVVAGEPGVGVTSLRVSGDSTSQVSRGI
jgi:hypothetical protein